MENTGAGKSPFTKLHHVGVVVRDINKAITFLESMGFGPFEAGGQKTLTIPFKGELHGRPAEWKTTISNADMGGVELELLEPTEGAQALQESLDAAGEGLHHIGVIVEDMDEALEQQTKAGAKVWTRSRMPGQRNFAYLEGTDIGNIVVELRTP